MTEIVLQATIYVSGAVSITKRSSVSNRRASDMLALLAKDILEAPDGDLIEGKLRKREGAL